MLRPSDQETPLHLTVELEGDRMPKLSPQKSLGFQVRRGHLRFDRLLNARLAHHNLKAGFWYYLRALWIADGVTQKELSGVTNVTETTMVAMINGMVADGLVTRTRDAIDKRKMRVKLTEYGRRLEGELMGIAIGINRVATDGIAPEDVATCIAVLTRVSENLRAEHENAVPSPATNKQRSNAER